MAIIGSGDGLFSEQVQIFAKLVDIPPIYDPKLIPYYKKIYTGQTTDLSFVVCFNQEPVAALFMVEQNIEKDRGLDYFGNSAILLSNPSSQHHDAALEEMSDFSSSTGLVKRMKVSDSLYEIAMSPSSIKMKTRLTETILGRSSTLKPLVYTKHTLQMPDNSNGEPVFSPPHSVRDSLRRARKSGLTASIIDNFTENNSLEEIFWKFRTIHKLAAGRETRSIDSWKEQLRLIREGHAFLAMVELNGESIGGALFLWGFNSVYYGVAANNPAHHRHAIGHLALQSAIEYSARQNGVFFWTGLQFSEKIDKVSQKKANIEKFKSGFGNSFSLYLQARR